MNTIFNDLDHRLSVIKRWGIAHTIHQQSVAEHIFNVERIAVRIATAWFNIQLHSEMMMDIVMWAHHHEDLEALSGDLPSMVKPYFDEEAMAREHSDIVTMVFPANDEVRNIVKLADMMDSFHFLCVEDRLGNRYLEDHWKKEHRRLWDYVANTWPDNPKIYDHVSRWMNDTHTTGSIRHSRRGR